MNYHLQQRDIAIYHEASALHASRSTREMALFGRSLDGSALQRTAKADSLLSSKEFQSGRCKPIREVDSMPAMSDQDRLHPPSAEGRQGEVQECGISGSQHDREHQNSCQASQGVGEKRGSIIQFRSQCTELAEQPGRVQPTAPDGHDDGALASDRSYHVRTADSHEDAAAVAGRLEPSASTSTLNFFTVSPLA